MISNSCNIKISFIKCSASRFWSTINVYRRVKYLLKIKAFTHFCLFFIILTKWATLILSEIFVIDLINKSLLF
jgi:hypothetical protein